MAKNQENNFTSSYERFLYKAFQKEFLVYGRMGFYYKRDFSIRWMEEKVSAFCNRIQEFGYGPLVVDPSSGILLQVREFYVILPIMDWDVPILTIYINRVDFPMDVQTINEVLRVLYVSNVGYLSKSWEMDIRWCCDMKLWHLGHLKQ